MSPSPPATRGAAPTPPGFSEPSGYIEGGRERWRLLRHNRKSRKPLQRRPGPWQRASRNTAKTASAENRIPADGETEGPSTHRSVYRWRVASQHCPLPFHRVIRKIRRIANLIQALRYHRTARAWTCCFDSQTTDLLGIRGNGEYLPAKERMQHVHGFIVPRIRDGRLSPNSSRLNLLSRLGNSPDRQVMQHAGPPAA